MRRRKKATEPDAAENTENTETTETNETTEAGGAAADPAFAERQARPERGPYDIDDIDPGATYVDLGSMLLIPPEGLDLRLQVEEESGSIASVLMVGEEGLIEVRAFACSRGGDLWGDARRQIAADTTQRGGTATEQEGPFGTELLCQVPVTGPEGESLVQPSRVLGHTGDRWFLRATIAGRAALDPDLAAPYEQAFADVVVNRGIEAMPPGEALPLRLPPEARRVE